jgi:hypothetical protein
LAVGYDVALDYYIQQLVPMYPGGTTGLNIQTEIFFSLIIKLSFKVPLFFYQKRLQEKSHYNAEWIIMLLVCSKIML